ncbi:uncharacterized protein [Eleutherodactylus coqui]|uniref:uncharacterized protein n=1 Tax=Eleutherodactylus coqui TaxID=57060 RepID=UPI0034630503
MRDTMELGTSLGYIFLKREELKQRNNTEPEETAQENAFQILEAPVTLGNALSSGEPFIAPYAERSTSPVVPPLPKTTAIQKHLEDSFVDEHPLFFGAQKTLGKERPDLPQTEMAFIHVVTPGNKARSPITGLSTEAVAGRLEYASASSGPVLSGASVDLFMESDHLVTQNLQLGDWDPSFMSWDEAPTSSAYEASRCKGKE